MKKIFVFIVGIFACNIAFAVHYHDNYSPSGVMNSHLHDKGDLMVGYYIQHTQSDDVLSGHRKISPIEAHGKYTMPTYEMTNTMHMFDVMYGLNDKVTIGAMAGYMEMKMTMLHHDHSTGGFDKMRHNIGGNSDTRLNALISLVENKNDNLHLILGISLPTGSIDRTHKDGNVMGYQMQFGSGTYDLLPGANYIHKFGNYHVGSQANITQRTGENSQGYRLGNVYNATIWNSYAITHGFSVSSRLNGIITDGVVKQSRQMDPKMDYMNVAGNTAGKRIDALAGTSYQFHNGLKLSAEAGAPIYQKLKGPQLSNRYTVNLGATYGFSLLK